MIALTLLGILFLFFLFIGGIPALIWRRKARAILRWFFAAYLLVAVIILFGIGPYFVAWAVIHSGTRPQDNFLRDTPAEYKIQYQDISFEARDSLHLSGWFIPPTGKRAVIIGTHGLFRNRIEVLARTVPLVKAGYGALLYDSRSHGASEKGVVSLGYYERNDVLGAIDYVQRRYLDSKEPPKIVLMGVSMGAVSTLEAAAETTAYSAIVLDSPFSSLKDTVIDHSWLLFMMPRYTFPELFLFWFQRMARFDAGLIDSHRALQKIQPVPLLIISSEGDRRIPPTVARVLYNESKSPTKKLEIFGRDVTHGAAASLHPEAYSKLLLSFLDGAIGVK